MLNYMYMYINNIKSSLLKAFIPLPQEYDKLYHLRSQGKKGKFLLEHTKQLRHN